MGSRVLFIFISSDSWSELGWVYWDELSESPSMKNYGDDGAHLKHLNVYCVPGTVSSAQIYYFIDSS